MIAAVCDGRYADMQQAVEACVAFTTRYTPVPSAQLEKKYRRFCALYDAAKAIAEME